MGKSIIFSVIIDPCISCVPIESQSWFNYDNLFMYVFTDSYLTLTSCAALDFSDLFEERALLLCRLGRHEVALAIYAHVMKEPEMAEELVQQYCIENLLCSVTVQW